MVDLTALPTLDQLEPEDTYIGWHFTLDPTVSRAKVEEVFEFVVDDCDLEIEPILSAVTAAAVTVTVDEPAAAAVPQAAANRPEAPAVQLGGQLPPDLCPALIGGLETLSQHLRELQEGVMAIRTQPVRSVFARMPRLVRELTSQLSKEARLVVTGEATEIDKTVVEQLADPLTRLLRNALDHGLEPPDEREAAGKPRQGTIHLSAAQRSSRIVIELSDDGRGIDRARVLARARERGLVTLDAVLTDAEIDELIFLPGFPRRRLSRRCPVAASEWMWSAATSTPWASGSRSNPGSGPGRGSVCHCL